MSATPIPVTLITGYLGSGKTTLLNHILTNEEGVRAAVIVNDIGEVNIDASLIQQNGVVDMSDSNLVPLSNGCICCSLAGDLTKQLGELADSGDYDHIFIEASGICEPIPIAYNIMAFGEDRGEGKTPLALDNIIAVVDAKRMFDEFAGGKALLADDLDEDDIETLLVQQLEFCTTVLLNKADLVTPEQMAELRAIVRSLQKEAVVIESTNADVPMAELIDTGRFDFEKAYSSAAWIDAMEHPEEHEDPEVLEYGIQTFVYREHRPFSRELFENVLNSWPRNVIRCQLLAAQRDPLQGHALVLRRPRHVLPLRAVRLPVRRRPERSLCRLRRPRDPKAALRGEPGDRRPLGSRLGRPRDRARLHRPSDGPRARGGQAQRRPRPRLRPLRPRLTRLTDPARLTDSQATAVGPAADGGFSLHGFSLQEGCGTSASSALHGRYRRVALFGSMLMDWKRCSMKASP